MRISDWSSDVCSSDLECQVYVIGKMKPELLMETFPGAAIRDWQPIQRSLKGRAAEVAKEIERRFSDPEVKSVGKGDLAAAVGFSSHRQLRGILDRSDFQIWMRDRKSTRLNSSN